MGVLSMMPVGSNPGSEMWSVDPRPISVIFTFGALILIL